MAKILDLESVGQRGGLSPPMGSGSGGCFVERRFF